MSVFDLPRKTGFNPYTLFFLFAGAVVVAYVALGASLLRQRQDHNTLSSEMESAEAVLAMADDVQQNVEELPGRLAEAQRELATAQIAFPSELDSNDIMHTVLALADEKGVRVLSLDAPPPATEPVDDLPPATEPVDAPPPGAEPEPTEEMSVDTSLSFDLQVEGDFGQLMTFLETLEEGETSTTRISAFTLQKADGRYLLDFELIAHARSTISEGSSPEEESTTDEGAEPSSDGQEAPRE